MKIAILAHLHHAVREPFAGGTEMHTAVVADELVRRGHQVTLFAKAGSRTAAELVSVVTEDFVFGHSRGPEGDRSEAIVTAAARTAIEQIRAGGYDVVLNNSLGPLPYTMLAGHPMMTVLHTPPTLDKVLAAIAPPWRPDPRHVWVSVSETNSASWRAYLPEVTCIPNGIRLDRWRDTGSADPELAVWSARITPEKGLHLAIDAVRQVGMTMRVCGPIADRGYFDDDIRPRLGDGITYAGHLPHDPLADLLARGAVFVSSSVWPEPFGLSLVEAMACGTPVAAFATGAAAEIVTPASGALAVEQTADALATAIATARSRPRAGARARATMFEAELMVDRYVEQLRIVQGRPHRSQDRSAAGISRGTATASSRGRRP